MYWFDRAPKGKLEGGHAKFFRENQKTTAPPLPIKNEWSLMILKFHKVLKIVETIISFMHM